ncbi:MAG: DUF2207 domain-containing protein [Candidatus Parcubacteria bacterium]|nr:DUF2207 domain-containing protein [Candidatus Parcubacteria bacterium]
MKKIVFILAISLGLLVALPVMAQEKIDSFDSKIQINNDATINVTETIKYNFGSEERHGIYRYIPIKYARENNKYNVRVLGVSVTDEKNHPYTYQVTYPGDNMEVKIGDADILISGVKTYVINYKLRRVINYFDDYDELYWNVTGDGWNVPIEKSSVTVLLPQNVIIKQLKSTCYVGPYGSTANCAQNGYILNSSSDTAASGVEYKHGLLNAYEGLTIVFGWPTGIVQKPTQEQAIKDFLEDNKAGFVFIFIGLACFIFWLFKGKDPAGRGTIIAEYDAPEGLSPAEVGTIIDEKTEKKDISAEIINLAVKGCLKIQRQRTGKSFTLFKLKELPAEAPGHEKKLLTALFGDKTEVKLSDLKDDFYKDFAEITNDIYNLSVTNGYFPKNPKKVRFTFLILGIIATVIIYGALDALQTTIGQVSCTISGIIVIIVSRFMPKKTEKGVLAKEQILGLKEYLTVAEKDRIKFHNAPEKNPELFEKLLPYAMVLGVETQWAKQFKDIYNEPPKWYDANGDISHFNSLSLINGLHTFSSQASTSLYTAPASASSGSSGFSGGGSGGGFGGGGGGSW